MTFLILLPSVSSKLIGVALLVADPPQCNFTPRQNHPIQGVTLKTNDGGCSAARPWLRPGLLKKTLA